MRFAFGKLAEGHFRVAKTLWQSYKKASFMGWFLSLIAIKPFIKIVKFLLVFSLKNHYNFITEVCHMDDFKKGVVNVTRSIAKGSGTLIKTTKLTMDLSSEESKLKALYSEIGKKVHEIYTYGGSLGEYFDKRYQDILEHQRKINELQEALDIAKGVKTCPKCGKTSPRSSTFCPKCGEDVSTVPSKTAEPPRVADDADATVHIPVPPSQAPPQEPQAPQGKKCNVCGSDNDSFDRFCLSCGRIL